MKPDALGPYSWHIALPTRQGDFTALHPEFAHCNRVSDLSRIQSFSVAGPSDNTELAWCDLQLAPCYPSGRSPGSGRAGVYKGWYLKGIGRTQLCFNWHIEDATMHGSGHMFASAALRELLVTAYARSCGMGHTLVPCESVLFRPLPETFSRQLQAHADKEGMTLSPIDRKLQAITVKPANFIRWSNLLGAAAFASCETTAVLEIARALFEGSHPAGEAELGQVTPSAVIHAVEAALERGFANFVECYRKGVYWNSYNNNFTLDGRFLDIELPTVLGAGRPAALAYFRNTLPAPTRVDGRATIAGEGPLQFVHQSRVALEQLSQHLERLAERTREPEVRGYAGELAEGLSSLARSRGLIANDEAIVDKLMPEWLAGGGRPDRLERALRDSTREILHGAPSCHYPDPQSCERFVDVVSPEPGISCRVFYPDASGAPPSERTAAARLFNEALVELDQLENVDECLSFTRHTLQHFSELSLRNAHEDI